jgi:predicted nucleic acid-binding protein
MPIILDTGVIYALADVDDNWHARARDFIFHNREMLLVPVTVLPEVAYLLARRLGSGAERAFVRSLAAGELVVEPIQLKDLTRCAGLLSEHPQIGFVDASVVAIAERMRVRVIATTDRRHFGIIRPKHVPAFELIP